MKRLDSRTAIYCHELLHKKYAPNAFPGLTPDAPDPVIEEFKNLGFSHEAKAIKALKARGGVMAAYTIHSGKPNIMEPDCDTQAFIPPK